MQLVCHIRALSEAPSQHSLNVLHSLSRLNLISPRLLFSSLRVSLSKPFASLFRTVLLQKCSKTTTRAGHTSLSLRGTIGDGPAVSRQILSPFSLSIHCTFLSFSSIECEGPTDEKKPNWTEGDRKGSLYTVSTGAALSLPFFPSSEPSRTLHCCLFSRSFLLESCGNCCPRRLSSCKFTLLSCNFLKGDVLSLPFSVPNVTNPSP